jgi:hypothetical protein
VPLGVIPKPRVFTSGGEGYPFTPRCGQGDPSLRLKNGCAQDDPSQKYPLRSVAHFLEA